MWGDRSHKSCSSWGGCNLREQASTQAVSFVPIQGSAMTEAMGHLPYQNLRYASRKQDSS